MPRRSRMRAAALGGLLSGALVAALAGCAPASAPRGATDCPPSLAGAVADKAVVGGTPTVRVAVASPEALGLRTTSVLLERSCVLVVRSIFTRDDPIVYQVLLPGGEAAADAVASAMLRDGWTPSLDQTPGARMLVGPGGGRGSLQVYGSHDFLVSLPPGAHIPQDSAYRDGPVVLLGLAIPATAGDPTTGSAKDRDG